jgi:hypothetical protein
MEYLDPIIPAFLEMLKNPPSDFPLEAWEDLLSLEQTLAELDDRELEEAADGIEDWAVQYPPVAQTLQTLLEQQAFGQRELNNIPRPNSNSEDGITRNIFRQLREAVKNRPSSPQQPPPNK